MSKKIYIIAVIAVCVVDAALPVHAQDSDPTLACPEKPNTKAKVRNLAGALFTEAGQSFEDERYLDALLQFLCSMSMIEHENTVINIKKALGEVKEKETALSMLTAYVGDHPDGELTGQIGQLADDLKKQLTPKEPTKKKEDCPSPPPQVAPQCPSETPKQLAYAKAVDRAHRVLWITGWINVGVGAGAFVSAVVLQGIAAAAKNKAQSATSYDVFMEQKDKNKSLQTAATTMFVSSALVAGVGVIHLLLHSEEQKKQRSLSTQAKPKPQKVDKENGSTVSVIPSGGLVWLKGTF